MSLSANPYGPSSFRPRIATDAENVLTQTLSATRVGSPGLPDSFRLPQDGGGIWSTTHALMSLYVDQARGKSTIVHLNHAATVLDPFPMPSSLASPQSPPTLWRGTAAMSIVPSDLLAPLADPKNQVIEVIRTGYGGAISSYMPQWQRFLGALGLNLYFQESVAGANRWDPATIHSLARIPSFALLQSALIAACGPEARIGFTSQSLSDDEKNLWLSMGCYPIRMSLDPVSDPRSSVQALEEALLDASQAIQYFTTTRPWMRKAAVKFYDVFFANPELTDNVAQFAATLGDEDRFSQRILDPKSRLASGIFKLKTDFETASASGDFTDNIRTVVGLVLKDDRFKRADLVRLLQEYRRELNQIFNFDRSDELAVHLNAIEGAILALNRGCELREVLDEIR